MRTLRTDSIAIIAGMRGTGKTEFLRKLASSLSVPMTLFDPLNQYPEFKNRRYVPRSDEIAEFEALSEKIWAKGNHLLVVEEAEIVFKNKAEITPKAKEIVLRGRNKGIGLFCCTRRIADFHKTPMSQANHLFLFKMYLPNDIAYISQFMPKGEADKLLTIPDYHFIHYADGEIEVCKPIELKSQ